VEVRYQLEAVVLVNAPWDIIGAWARLVVELDALEAR
jgi:hypothetical protein